MAQAAAARQAEPQGQASRASPWPAPEARGDEKRSDGQRRGRCERRGAARQGAAKASGAVKRGEERRGGAVEY